MKKEILTLGMAAALVLSLVAGISIAFANGDANPIRDMPDSVKAGEDFDITVTWTAPSDDFNAIGLHEWANKSANMTVTVDKAWCNPVANAATAAENDTKAEISWYGPYSEGTEITAKYKVHVPIDADEGDYTFDGYLEYYISGSGPYTEDVAGDSVINVIEAIPPASVTNLNETEVGCTWINWTWTNPSDSDFHHVMVYNGLGEHMEDVEGEPGEMSYINTSDYGCTLAPNTTYEIRTRTVDIAGNVNQTWVNDTAKTRADEEDPTVTVIAPNGGESWKKGSKQQITWTATDNVDVTAIDIYYSTDSGATYPNIIATGETNDRIYTWTVPSTLSKTCRVKVVAHDATGNTDEDESNADFEIKKVSTGGRGTPRDTDGDGYTDVQEMLADTDENDPCDPDPECAACIASKPAATPTPTPTPTPTVTPTPTIPPVVTTPTPTPTEEPGFEAVFAIAGLLAVAYLVLRRKRK